MTSSIENEERIAFLRKKNEARKKSMALDWEKDKNFAYGNKPGFRYLSVEKMKRNLLPVFVECGLDFKFDYGNLQQREAIGSMSQHWILECTATLTDIDTGYFETTVVMGEAGDSGDKALGKASTYALKTWLADTFMLIDGVDPDQGNDLTSIRTYTPKSDKEQEEVKSKVFANSIPVPPATKPIDPIPTPPATKPAEPVNVSAPVVPKNIPGTMKDSGDPTVPKAPVPPVPVPKVPGKKVDIPPIPKPKMPDRSLKPGEEKIEQLKIDKISNYKPSEPQKMAFDRIFRYFGKKGQEGEITTEFAEQLAKDRSEIGSNSEAIAFIRKYEVPDDFE